MKKATNVGVEVLTLEALFGWLEFIDETGEKVYFYLQMQIELKSCVTLFSGI